MSNDTLRLALRLAAYQIAANRSDSLTSPLVARRRLSPERQATWGKSSQYWSTKMLSTIDQAVLAHLKGQREGITFQDLLDATGLDDTSLSVAVVALAHVGLISSGEGEYPRYQLAQVVPLGYARAPVCVSCVKCGECPDLELEEAAVRL